MNRLLVIQYFVQYIEGFGQKYKTVKCQYMDFMSFFSRSVFTQHRDISSEKYKICFLCDELIGEFSKRVRKIFLYEVTEVS